MVRITRPTLEKIQKHIDGLHEDIVMVGPNPIIRTFSLTEETARRSHEYDNQAGRYYGDVEMATVLTAARRPATDIEIYRSLFKQLVPETMRVNDRAPYQHVDGEYLVVSIGQIQFSERIGRLTPASDAVIEDPEAMARIAAVMKVNPDEFFGPDGHVSLKGRREDLSRGVKVMFYPSVKAAEDSHGGHRSKLFLPLRRKKG